MSNGFALSYGWEKDGKLDGSRKTLGKEELHLKKQRLGDRITEKKKIFEGTVISFYAYTGSKVYSIAKTVMPALHLTLNKSGNIIRLTSPKRRDRIKCAIL